MEHSSRSLCHNFQPPQSYHFITVPLELRQLIYLYLIPNRTVPASIPGSNPHIGPVSSIFREDRSPCSPALLRVNRQIYNEFVRFFYGHTLYCVTLACNYIRMTNLAVYHHRATHLPFNLHFLTRIQLNVEIIHLPEDIEHQNRGCPSTSMSVPNLRPIDSVAQFFSPQGHGRRLKELTLKYFLSWALLGASGRCKGMVSLLPNRRAKGGG
jgi:hypothetical protein